MKNFGENRRSCIYICKGKNKKAFILDEYEEQGGPLDGQEFLILEDQETNEEVHVKKEHVLEIID